MKFLTVIYLGPNIRLRILFSYIAIHQYGYSRVRIALLHQHNRTSIRKHQHDINRKILGQESTSVWVAQLQCASTQSWRFGFKSQPKQYVSPSYKNRLMIDFATFYFLSHSRPLINTTDHHNEAYPTDTINRYTFDWFPIILQHKNHHYHIYILNVQAFDQCHEPQGFTSTRSTKKEKKVCTIYTINGLNDHNFTPGLPIFCPPYCYLIAASLSSYPFSSFSFLLYPIDPSG